MSYISIQEVEDTLADEGWEPEYREDGAQRPNPYYEILVDGEQVFVELMDANDSFEPQTVSLVRISSFDEDGNEILDAWDVEDIESAYDIIQSVREYIEANFR